MLHFEPFLPFFKRCLRDLSLSLLCVAVGLAKKLISTSAFMSGHTCPLAITSGRSLVVVARSFDRCSAQLCLSENHPYFAQVQVQGQMVIDGKPWRDFILFTTKGISV